MNMPPQNNKTSQRKQVRRLDNLMQKGYHLMEAHHASQQASDLWLEAWQIVKALAQPTMRTCEAFDQAYPVLRQSVFNWTHDVDMELHNAGIHHAPYHERRIEFVHEFFDVFPDEMNDANRVVNFMRAEGEALWQLGRREESDAVYEQLLERLPDEGWGYIGWADDYWIMHNSPNEFEKAEGILLRGLERPTLQDRTDVLDRLYDLYLKWDKPEQADAIGDQLDQLLAQPQPQLVDHRQSKQPISLPPELLKAQSGPPARKLGRNERCWCGSGKKYKHCHWKSDQGRGG
jgi:tetratricopeptide (TPR) repeat protein